MVRREFWEEEKSGRKEASLEIITLQLHREEEMIVSQWRQ